MGVEEKIGLGFRGWGAVQDFGRDVRGAGEADEGAANVGDEYLWVCKVYTRVCIHALTSLSPSSTCVSSTSLRGAKGGGEGGALVCGEDT